MNDNDRGWEQWKGEWICRTRYFLRTLRDNVCELEGGFYCSLHDPESADGLCSQPQCINSVNRNVSDGAFSPDFPSLDFFFFYIFLFQVCVWFCLGIWRLD